MTEVRGQKRPILDLSGLHRATRKASELFETSDLSAFTLCAMRYALCGYRI
jgi:hypothetical protein